ncbi:non-ribosomal peptide synthetase, partial [Micromonospora sp. CPCC 205371]|nr:non-ribosomal peptide synthetase [Micromonospora sp. CPCC 205371]
EWLTGEVLDGQLAYWRRQLDGLPTLDLPTDRPRPPLRELAGAVTRFAVPAEVANGLRAVSQDNGATMFMTTLAAFAVVLGRYSESEDVVIGSPVANRGRAEVEDLIGFFVNTLVLRADLSGDPTFGELLARVRQTVLDAYAHQDLPFEQLVDALAVERDRSRTPLVQVVLNYAALDRDEGVPTPDALDDAVQVKFDLIVTLGETGDGLAGEIQYSSALFDAVTVERLGGHLATVLAGVAADPSVPLSRLSLL